MMFQVECRIGGAAWGQKIQYESLTPILNLLPLWGQEPAMLHLAKQIHALTKCAGELCSAHDIAPAQFQMERAELYANGIPAALHDPSRYTYS